MPEIDGSTCRGDPDELGDGSTCRDPDELDDIFAVRLLFAAAGETAGAQAGTTRLA